jgi:hypothetical protein
MPDARFEVLPDTGHLPQIDRADTVASAIIGFLATQTQCLFLNLFMLLVGGLGLGCGRDGGGVPDGGS